MKTICLTLLANTQYAKVKEIWNNHILTSVLL